MSAANKSESAISWIAGSDASSVEYPRYARLAEGRPVEALHLQVSGWNHSDSTRATADQRHAYLNQVRYVCGCLGQCLLSAHHSLPPRLLGPGFSAAVRICRSTRKQQFIYPHIARRTASLQARTQRSEQPFTRSSQIHTCVQAVLESRSYRQTNPLEAAAGFVAA